jgi:protein-S-isoprenylcysteine O-methyltransferase Ste14
LIQVAQSDIIRVHSQNNLAQKGRCGEKQDVQARLGGGRDGSLCFSGRLGYGHLDLSLASTPLEQLPGKRRLMMVDWKGTLARLHPHLLAWIWTGLLILQMILAFFVVTDPRSRALRVAGWAIWALGTVFAILPIFALRGRGRVPKGKSYMETTTLVDTGIYAIARHPQGGTAALLFSLALAFIGQHWLIAVLAVVGMVLVYLDTFKADEACIEKFGQQYVDYMQHVPRVNFVSGLLRQLIRSRPESTEV